MRTSRRVWSFRTGCVAAAWAAVATMTLPAITMTAQQAATPPPAASAPAQTPAPAPTPPPNPNAAATAADHKNMMEQLGITALRPGPSGNESAPNHANYDEALANPYPEPARRADAEERPEGHERRRRGGSSGGPRSSRTSIARCSDASRRTCRRSRGPSTAPRTSRWAGRPVVGKELVGHVDNSSYPAISVDIQMTLVTPADATRPVPVMMMFGGRSGMPPAPGTPPPAARGFGPGRGAPPNPATPADPPATEQLIADGWGYATINPDSIQADNGAGLTAGHHRPRQQGPAAQAGRLGLAARVGVGRVARPRLSRDRQGGRREEGRHRRRLALRQGGARDDGLRPAVRGRARRLVGRRRRQAASPQLRRSGREPHRLGRVSLDGRQLPEVRRGRGDVRQQERRRHSGGRAPADRALRAAPDVHQLRRAREGRREVARSAGQLHGRRRRAARCSACSARRTSACRTTT